MAVYSVSQVVVYLKELLEQDSVLRDVWIRGEVSNLARPGSGHAYYSLSDGDSALQCVSFRQAFGGDLLTDGAAVIVHGRLSIYEVRGALQLIVDMVRPEGVGELQLKLEELKLRLGNEGLFDESRKRPLPQFPARVGVVTSPTGSVWHDIRNVVGRRYPLTELLLAPAAVQGEDATQSIVEALEAVNQAPDVDVVILARGGGSLEDLWSFNEEPVARAIFASRAPVISGVGHETDLTIADMVADRRAPTPSAAAEMAVPDKMELVSGLAASHQSLVAAVSGQVRHRWDAITRLRPRLRRSRPDLDRMRLHVDDLLRSVADRLRRDCKMKSERAASLGMRLESLSPKGTLRRGYAIVHADGAELVTDSAQLERGDRVQVSLASGGFGAEVLSTDGTTEDREAVSITVASGADG